MKSNNSLVNFLNTLQSDYSSPEEYKDYEESIYDFYMNLTQHYSCVMAKQMSKLERESLKLTSNSFSYGEIPFESLSRIFAVIQQKHKSLIPDGGTFYDLGSGVGKSVFAVALLYPFDQCIGIEYLDSLHKSSLEILANFNSIKHSINITPHIKFIHEDLTKFDWSDGTFIYASTTCYDPRLMQAMSDKALSLSKDTVFITLTKPIQPVEQWTLLDQFRVRTSWGEATLYLQIKK